MCPCGFCRSLSQLSLIIGFLRIAIGSVSGDARLFSFTLCQLACADSGSTLLLRFMRVAFRDASLSGLVRLSRQRSFPLEVDPHGRDDCEHGNRHSRGKAKPTQTTNSAGR